MKKVMLHQIMPDQVSGPNIAAERISKSYLRDKYKFEFLTQSTLAGGKINLKLIMDLKKQIKQFDPDVIHISGMQSSGFHAVIASRLAGYRNILLTVRGFAFDDSQVSFIKKIVFKYIIEPLTLKLSRKVYVVSKESENKEMIKKLNKKKYLGVIHNAAPEIKYSSTEYANYRQDFRGKLGYNEDDFVVIVVGRIVIDKGILDICEAARKSDVENIKFLIVGDGPLKEELQEEYSTEISNHKLLFFGKTSNVLSLLCASDVFLFGTYHENLSNALLEAMTVGLPVVVTNVGGNMEVVEENYNGYFISPNDPDDINAKINSLNENKKLCKYFSKNSRNIIENKFSQKVIYEKIDRIYKSLM